ncbi:MAG: PAS domain-containing protein [Gemmataceae bacterium]
MTDDKPARNRRNRAGTPKPFTEPDATRTLSLPPRESLMTPTDTRSTPAAPGHVEQLASLDFVKATLDDLQTNIFVADISFTIVYANRRALDTLRKNEDELRAAFGVEVDDLVGCSIHTFHKDKKRVEKILKNPRALPHAAEFSFGNVVFQTNINSIMSGRDVVGYVVNWEDVSRQRAIESEQSRLTSMLENAPTNVLMADRDLKIIYVNLGVARHAQEVGEVPARAGRGCGSTSIDVFHKPLSISGRFSRTRETSPCGPTSRSVPRPLICS